MGKLDKSEEICGTIENVVYRNESNDYTVFEISDAESNLITAVGIIPMAFEGERVVLRGSYTYHKEFGRQFAFDAFEKTLPEEVDGILQYLSSRTVKGVGPVTALKIVNKFGTETFDVIENHPEWLSDIPGITMKKAAAISESFREQTGMRGVMMLCSGVMSAGDASRVYKKLGVGAVGILQANPYILCDGEFGIPFDKADSIARALNVPHDSRERILSGIKYVLSYNASVNGHTCLPDNKLVLAASELLEIDADTARTNLDELLDEGELASMKIDDTLFVMTCEVAEDEDYIAKKLFMLSENADSFGTAEIGALVEKVEIELGISFAPLQREALYSSLRSGVMVLTGGPGTGKTTVIKAMLSIFRSLGMKVALAAPTGRAAKRMSEATGEEAKTVHRMLEMEHNFVGETKFYRNERSPISESVIIVDEASMLDLSLTAALLRAIKRGSRLILIGDSDQLPSVGAGNVLSDIIATERIKTVRLTEIFRQSKESLIVTNAHKINNGESPNLAVTDNDFFFVRREADTDIPEAIATLITERLPRTYGREIRDVIQVITPSKKGVGGVENLNTVLQESINPRAKFKKEKQAHGVIFREGDRVMQIANNYDIEWEKNGAVGTGLFNGDIGVIQSINESEEAMTIWFDDRVAEYSFDLLSELELAYAITVHKSQGSEYPVVIIPMYYCPPMLMTRNLFYTAVTRAKKMVILVGKSEIPRKMVANNSEVMRYTALKQKIFAYY
ncbi:MAG: ATP-dependent RecD-like DNA helicase [Clostridia bacterium]|nr:ATP-dependent RecD-like DNA helicase [Clostridia bacterium]